MPDHRRAGIALDAGLLKRVASASVLAPIALVLVYLGGWSYLALIAIAAVLMAWEWGRMQPSDPEGKRVGSAAGWLAGITTVAAVIVAGQGQPSLAIALVAIASGLCALLARRLRASRFAASAGILYLGLPAIAMMWLRALPDIGLPITVALLVVIWATDIFAYLVGRQVGGPRLAPSISPRKTWSGLGGGIAGAAAVGIGAILFVADQGSVVGAIVLAGVVAVIAQVGDLFESAIKRRAGCKDSSDLIPGHGGVLDRLDGLLFAAPLVALVLIVFGRNILPW
ncbi:phosphatidate cytidylyltransferase [Marinivivus vitaminiproducens]|uniref:phosphatidate cytidylyltransferase n=1 Tax=Marinivivus vitaminiproducens TaxID=3035935 RepID=UPI002799FCC9|nr:phosphatidate cytidylyltransferase [Geminicoccaceae bacterium SCSIO 64248]